MREGLPTPTGLFICEGTSDLALADVVSRLFLARGVQLRMSTPDFSLLERSVAKDVESRIRAALTLGPVPDVLVVHRDADAFDIEDRRDEILGAQAANALECHLVPVVPMRATEAWLLLDEAALRTVAGNPRGRRPLALPTPREAERLADPKTSLSQALLDASETRGRRRENVRKRFSAHRRLLVERLDTSGPVKELVAFRAVEEAVADVSAQLVR